MLRYEIRLTPDDNGTLLVTAPALPEVTTYGETEAEARERAVEAVEEALAARMADGRDIPADVKQGPRTIQITLHGTIKIMVYLAFIKAGINRAELARRLNWHREQVDRLFRFDHQSRLDQVEAAMRALGAELDVKLAA